MPADYTRIHRLLRILTLIQGETGWSAERLAEACGVTVRTIYRDMKSLEGAGIPYFHDEQTNGYRVRRDFYMPPVQLTLEESLALVALGEHIGGREQIPLTRAAAKAVSKVRSVMPHNLRDELEQLDKHIAIKLAKAGPFDGIDDVYMQVREAILRCKGLRCCYESVKGPRDQKTGDLEIFLFDPYKLFFSKRAWYVIGHHHGRDEQRCLKLNRFTRIEPTGATYTIPKDFDLDDRLGHAWQMIRGKKRYAIELWFAPEFAETIADTHWHTTQEVEWHDDGSILFRCTVDGLEEIVWWVLSMGPNCRVHKPRTLANQVRQLVTHMVELYETG